MFFKFTYYQQNVCWVQVANMVREGYTHDMAIDLSFRGYGQNCAVTKLLMAMIRDKKTGGHPTLKYRQLELIFIFKMNAIGYNYDD